MPGVRDVEQILAGQLAANLQQNGQSADAGVEDADRVGPARAYECPASRDRSCSGLPPSPKATDRVTIAGHYVPGPAQIA